ncbi:hypothetical protein BGZ94_004255 [Podila epigama]|nr:hypothetical protein BGZ94_004255 [Podila epigama]
MTGMTIPKGWFKKRITKQKVHQHYTHHHTHHTLAISSPSSTASGASSICHVTRPRQPSTASSTGSSPQKQLETVTTTRTNRSSTGMTAVSSSSTSMSLLFRLPGSPFSSKKTCGRRDNVSTSMSCLSHKCSKTAIVDDDDDKDESPLSLPAHARDNTSRQQGQHQPPRFPTQSFSPGTKPPSTQQWQQQQQQQQQQRLRQHALTQSKQEWLPISESIDAKNGMPVRATSTINKAHPTLANVSRNSSLLHGNDNIINNNNNNHHHHHHHHHHQSRTAQTRHDVTQPKPSRFFMERSSTQRQPSKILRNLSARFGSSTETLPISEAATETVAQEYARTIKALWRMVEEEELSQRMADASPAEREWIIMNYTTFPITDVTMSHPGHLGQGNSGSRPAYTPPRAVRESVTSDTSSQDQPRHRPAHGALLPFQRANGTNISNPHQVYSGHGATFHDSKIQFPHEYLHYYPPNEQQHQHHHQQQQQQYPNGYINESQYHHQNTFRRNYHRSNRFSCTTVNTTTSFVSSSVGPEDASSCCHRDYDDDGNPSQQEQSHRRRFTLLSEGSTTTVSTEAMKREMGSRSQEWFQQQLQEHGYQGYNSHISRLHDRYEVPGHVGYEKLNERRREGYEDEDEQEREREEYATRVMKLEALERELSLLDQYNIQGSFRFQEGETGEQSRRREVVGGRGGMGMGMGMGMDEDEGVIGLARKVPVRKSMHTAELFNCAMVTTK